MKIYRYYNPNPRGRSVGDCTVRAVLAALGVSWDAAFRGIARQARSMADMPSAVALWDKSAPSVYLKKSDMTGRPSMVIYDLVERRKQPAKQNTEQGILYATKTDLKDVLDVVDDLKRQLDEMRLKTQNNAPDDVL